MIDKKIQSAICTKGRELQKDLPRFFGKIVLNYSNGLFVVANVEQSLKEDPKERKSK